MDQAGDGVFVLRLHRHHVPVGADGDDGLLEVLGLVGGDELLQDVPHLGLRGTHVPADGGQLGAGRVGNLLLPQDGIGDGVLQKAVGGEGPKEVGDGGLFLSPAVLPHAAGAAQHRRDVQQLPGAEAAPHVRPLEGGGHRPDPGEAGGPPQDQHLHRGAGLLLGPLHVVPVGHGPQGQAALLPLLRGGAVGQQLQHPGQLQGLEGFFKQFTHMQNS